MRRKGEETNRVGGVEEGGVGGGGRRIQHGVIRKGRGGREEWREIKRKGEM